MTQTNFPNPAKFIVPILVVFLIAAAFAIGMLWTKVSFLEKGSSTKGSATGAEGAGAPATTATDGTGAADAELAAVEIGVRNTAAGVPGGGT